MTAFWHASHCQFLIQFQVIDFHCSVCEIRPFKYSSSQENSLSVLFYCFAMTPTTRRFTVLLTASLLLLVSTTNAELSTSRDRTTTVLQMKLNLLIFTVYINTWSIRLVRQLLDGIRLPCLHSNVELLDWDVKVVIPSSQKSWIGGIAESALASPLTLIKRKSVPHKRSHKWTILLSTQYGK